MKLPNKIIAIMLAGGVFLAGNIGSVDASEKNSTVETKKVELSSENNIKSGTKEFILEVKDENGVKTFGFKDMEPEYMESAKEYINSMITQGNVEGNTKASAVALTQYNKEYNLNNWGNDQGDSSSEAYVWAKYKTPQSSSSVYNGKTWGGTSAVWNKSGFNQMRLRQEITVNKNDTGVSIGYPGGFTVSNASANTSTAKWQSSLVKTNPTGATTGETTISSKITSKLKTVVYRSSADIYVTNSSRIYKPVSTVTFNNYL